MSHQAFLDFCREQECGDIDFGNQDSQDCTPNREVTAKPLAQANSVSSNIKGTEMHRPALDIDVPCLLIDSTTPGHHHLYIDKPMPWEDYEKLIRVLAEIGILQQGYADVSIKRKRTWLRTPWTKKEK